MTKKGRSEPLPFTLPGTDRSNRVFPGSDKVANPERTVADTLAPIALALGRARDLQRRPDLPGGIWTEPFAEF